MFGWEGLVVSYEEKAGLTNESSLGKKSLYIFMILKHTITSFS